MGCKAALNNKIGYDQYQRGTYWTQLKAVGYDPEKITVACESDCSAGVAANVKAAGYILNIPALQNVSSGMSSRTTVDQLKKAGFTVITDRKYLTSSKYLLPGDILLYVNHHVATNITKGSAAKAITTPGVTAGNIITYTGQGIGTAIANQTMNVRVGSSTNDEILGSIAKGKTVEVLEVLSNGWYKIVWENATTGFGYVSNVNNQYFNYTATATKQTTSDGKKEPASKTNPYGADQIPQMSDTTLAGNYKIDAASAINIRKGPGIEHDVIMSVSKTIKLTCDGSYSLSTTGVKWLYVTAKVKSITVEGFASEKYLTKV